MKTNKWLVFCVLSSLVLSAGCGKKEEEQPAAPAAATSAPAATPIDPATAGSVSGTVKFDGAAPRAAKIDMGQDPNCAGSNTAENVVVADGKLANVFVYVKEGLGNRTFDVPKDAVTLTQIGCKYKPHVLGVMAGQTIKIVNGDPTTHNITPHQRTIAIGTSLRRRKPPHWKRLSREKKSHSRCSATSTRG